MKMTPTVTVQHVCSMLEILLSDFAKCPECLQSVIHKLILAEFETTTKAVSDAESTKIKIDAIRISSGNARYIIGFINISSMNKSSNFLQK
jgi:hypothetical protein